jgi:hypothetical protein
MNQECRALEVKNKHDDVMYKLGPGFWIIHRYESIGNYSTDIGCAVSFGE